MHWPYCARICPYCDFNVYAAKERDTAPLVAAMKADLVWHKQHLPNHSELDTIFFGGGTPSLMGVRDVEAIVSSARETFGLAATAEITLEANPNDITPETLLDWKSAGINRLSIGVQSLQDKALEFLGRDHSSSDARRALDHALQTFSSVSIDLIYARPEQTPSEWERELTDALKLGAHHLSLYELTIAQRTAFGLAARRGTLIPMPDDAQADLYELTDALTREAGYSAYEVSNHALSPAHQSRHNEIYWQSGDWIGIGPGAHGRLTTDHGRVAVEAVRQPGAYINGAPPNWEVLDPLDTAREILAMGLRPVSGIALTRLPQLDSEALSGLISNGLIEIVEGRLRTTPSGRLLTDAIVSQLSP